MTTIELFRNELEQEAQTTRKMLERIPDEKYGWAPHPKSMTIKQLATHIAELPSWIPLVFTTEELDFAANPYKPVEINNTRELLEYFETNLELARTHWQQVNEDDLARTWVLRNGDDIYTKSSKAEFARVTYSQIVHHRAQMGVFLRLLDVPVPGSYGPSADDLSF